MPNRLAGSTSPYLLQHQNNPVDWYPWCDEAIAKAKAEDKPIFLSIGYSACHWCHVMEHESFENESIAAILNEHFVSIKVDREQRPDLDHIYMQVVQMLTGSGGWPMSVFLSPDTKPFYGGTYWPPSNRYGRPGFPDVLQTIISAWHEKRTAIEEQSEQIVSYLNQAMYEAGNDGTVQIDEGVRRRLLKNAEKTMLELFDPHFGGFGQAPKFPHASDLMLLQRLESYQPMPQRYQAIVKTLDCMYAGGIYDHLAGGFARYSVDERWLVPHFEKMLYDNALLVQAYLDGYRLTGDLTYKVVVSETIDYVLKYMTDPNGGFYSAEDADSEGVEGKFYVWTVEEIQSLLDSTSAKLFCQYYDVTQQGNFEGDNILNIRQSMAYVANRFAMPESELRLNLDASRKKLLGHRDQRIRPGLDDKVLTSWNALMISALTKAGVVLDQQQYLDAAIKAAMFIEQNLYDSDGYLMHCWRAGHAEITGFLDDYSYWIISLLDLWEMTNDVRWIKKAITTCDQMIDRFSDKRNGGFFFTASDAETLIARTKDTQDGSVPSGNAMAALALARLYHWIDDDLYGQHAADAIQSNLSLMERAPTATSHMLIALDTLLNDQETIVAVTFSNEDDSNYQKFRQLALQSYSPNRRIWIGRASGDGSVTISCEAIKHWIENRKLPSGIDWISFRCIGKSCESPILGFEEIIESFDSFQLRTKL